MTVDLIDQTLHYLQECFHPGTLSPSSASLSLTLLIKIGINCTANKVDKNDMKNGGHKNKASNAEASEVPHRLEIQNF
jgi:hypothetical protein